jgi:hypothetical protein
MAKHVCCPSCGLANIPERATCKQCCAPLYATPTQSFADLIELRQLEFLVDTTADWPVDAAYRVPYIARLAALGEAVEPAVAPPPIVAAEAPRAAVAAAPPAPPAEPAVPPAKAERISFDQWLLSERNIKIALYSGGLLLVLAGLIFVGVNWVYFSGPIKFAITLMITGLMELGGYLLFQRPMLKLGGVALLGVASGFVPLNFAVLQIYVFSALDERVMWLIASPICLILYALTAYWTRADLFTYLVVAALASTASAGLALLDAPFAGYLLAYALLALICLLGARASDHTRLADFTRAPLLIVSHVAAPLVFLAGYMEYEPQPSWLAIAAMTVVVLCYVATDLVFEWLAARAHGIETLFHWFAARWAAALLLVVPFTLALTQLHFSALATGIALQGLALAYLGAGYTLERRAALRPAGLPLYVACYVVAGLVTFQALATFGQNPADLAKALLGDVIVLAASAAVYRRYEWIYGAVWLLIAPVLIYAGLYLHGAVDQGLALGVLMLNYVAAGYVLGRRSLRLGGPFLSAAAFLSLAVAVLTWASPVVASAALVAIAGLYLFVALWLSRSELLIPALAAVNLAIITIATIFLPMGDTWLRSIIVTAAALGVALTLGGYGLWRRGQSGWAAPLFLAGGLDVAVSYMLGLTFGGALAIGLSIVFAVLAFWLAWATQTVFAARKLPPLLAYFGIATIFGGHFWVIDLSAAAWQVWPIYTIALCALFVALAWLLRRGLPGELYGRPLRMAGLALTLVPMVGVDTIANVDSPLIALTLAGAGIIYTADALAHRQLYLGYVGGGVLIAALWAFLFYADVTELQAYAAPLGLALVVLGWNERRREVRYSYRAATLLGLLILMGSAFMQSLDAPIYAWLLLAESLAAVAWGVRTHSRGYVEVGALALIANAIAQFGPGFIELPHWIQLGSIGAILLGGGLAALLRREQILATRRALVGEWRQWQP